MYVLLQSGIIHVNLMQITIDISNTNKADAPSLGKLIIAHPFLFSLSFHPARTPFTTP